MDSKIKETLNEVITKDLEKLSFMDLGSDEYAMALDEIVKLHKLRIEEAKIQLSVDERLERHLMEVEHRSDDAAHHEDEQRLKEEQLNEQAKDRYFRLGIEAAGIVLPLIFYACWMRKGFMFEETGTFTSSTFKGLVHYFKPTKK